MTPEFIIVNSIFIVLLGVIGFFIRDALSKIRDDLKELKIASKDAREDSYKKSLVLEAIAHDKQTLFDKLNRLEMKIEQHEQNILEIHKEYKQSLDFVKENHMELHELVKRHKAS